MPIWKAKNPLRKLRHARRASNTFGQLRQSCVKLVTTVLTRSRRPRRCAASSTIDLDHPKPPELDEAHVSGSDVCCELGKIYDMLYRFSIGRKVVKLAALAARSRLSVPRSTVVT